MKDLIIIGGFIIFGIRGLGLMGKLDRLLEEIFHRKGKEEP